MTITIKEISWGFVWTAAGLLSAWLFMLMIKASVNKLGSEQKTPSAVLLVLGSFLRWALMGVFLFFAVKMHLVYALVFILAFTILRFILIFRLHRQTKIGSGSAGEG